MAFTISRREYIAHTRCKILNVDIDSASGNIDTGLSVVHGFSLSPISMATAGIKLKANVGSGATAVNGNINVNAAASGDNFYLVVFGV